MTEIIRIDNNTWRFEDDFVRFFLLEGKDTAVLIDSGVNSPDAANIARTATDKPIILLNTHGDGDHLSGTNGFSEIHIHPEDYINCKIKAKYPNASLAEIADGDIMDLGERSLKIIHIPGHTKGSVAVLDVSKRTLYAGDSVQKGHIYMFGAHRSVEQFEDALNKLISLDDGYDVIYASHDEYMLPGDYVQKVKRVWKMVLSGELGYEEISLHGKMVKSYTAHECGFYLE